MTLADKKMEAMMKVAPINGGGLGKVTPAQVITPAKVITNPTQLVTPPAHQEQVAMPQQVNNTNSVDFRSLPYNDLKSLAFQVVGKLNAIRSELKTIFLEREDVIDDLMRALVAGQHLLMLGPPGTGKSALAEELTARIVMARIFKWLLNKTSDPSEVVGPVSIKNMERDKYIRILDGKLADCEIAFIDEIFKSNEPTLNAMLPILNEKIVYNDGKAIKIPLKMMIAASNETPEEGEGLEALYDRILIKHDLSYIKDPANRESMMGMYNNRRNPFTQSNGMNKTTVTIDEIDVVQYFKDAVVVPQRVTTAFGKLLNKCDKQKIKFSDRKVNWCMDIIKANALLNGRDTADDEDLASLVYILWEEKKDIQFLKEEIAKLINPYDQSVTKYYAESMEIINGVLDLAKTDKKKATEESLEVKSKVEVIIGKLDKTIAQAKANGKDITAMTGKRDEVFTKCTKMVYDVLGIDPTNPLGNPGNLPF